MITKKQIEQKESQLEAYPWKWWENEFVKAEWIDDDSEMWMVNGIAGRRPVSVPLTVEGREEWAKDRYRQLFLAE